MGVFDAGSILAHLRLDKSGFAAGMLSAQNIAHAFGPTVTAFMTNPLLGFVQVGKQVVELFGRQERADARLNAVLRATGQAAGFTLDELKEMAGGLQQVTEYGNETIQEMQGILLTFKSIKGDEFRRATELTMDLAAVMGGDLKSAALQLGKALEDPKTGLTALRRSGVSFTEQEKAQIEAMVEAGQVAQAQQEILAALAGQVGGTARELGATAAGTWQRFKNTLSDLGEVLGSTVMPLLEAVANILGPILKLLEPVVDLLGKLIKYSPIGLLGDLAGRLAGRANPEGPIAEMERFLGGGAAPGAGVAGELSAGMRQTATVANRAAVARIRSERERTAAEIAFALT